MNDTAFEVNFDGIVGPTHNYSGLSHGNIASVQNQYTLSNPREAALQGLEKMKFMTDLGLKQAVLPPHERPHLPTLRLLGFSGSDPAMITSAFEQAPEILFSVSSAAAMWAANAATTTPSSDSQDKRVHFTPANLSSKFHRSIEHSITGRLFKMIFNHPDYFITHQKLPQGVNFCDEGAANHNRFCQSYGGPGIHLFVYGRSGLKHSEITPSRFPARQTSEASQAVARLHRLNPKHTLFAQQHPDAIDSGAFHNDVVAVGNKNVFLFHEQAFLEKEKLIDTIRRKMRQICHVDMLFMEIKAQDISLSSAISSYLFNSQIVSLPDETMAILAPAECQEDTGVNAFLENMIRSSENPINQLHFSNIRHSMRNGGGPACLRIRIVLTSAELAATHPQIFLTESLYIQLKGWIKKHYRDRLLPHDLTDPNLLYEGRQALDELTRLLNLGSIYDFQMV
jgi:succinylarginine dihydrolase